MEIIVGTTNQGKLREMQLAYAKKEITFSSYSKYTTKNIVVEESGQTYAENALLKARTYAKKLGQPVLADDGGLEIQAFPTILGIKTARFFPKQATDSQKNQRLLALFSQQPDLPRVITLHAVLAYAKPTGEYLLTKGKLTGTLAEQEIGELGYGFDKIFYLPELKKTLAQLPDKRRNELSPRISALRAMMNQLEVYGE
ncbi:non-canonical purine NTP pyrophosphatase [Erwinia sp. CPCC 100877]|nr:non-canonical purine NTP pyrophosphatase [Erwinia sp. CPCC 100877]